ncbi:PaaI family thioesterase [Sphingopyxis sp. OPL5]|uniref:PaaI family thioesterase n=1 Tax=Sphingopyxis sp. OPL5 TaxID=2486273 RepID=UPI0008D201C6|nr:PaaI family thioesterase [Sphingopyxis sp. OPL5]OHD02388.1 MAG: phenylacetic acid degradation protein [Sphingopyxis sp. RIFCSPHIGHO2_01_FULL_65_24]QNO26825.1 PaaI family thioesterase [Sphingopyxis sp. OPL5]
MRPFEQDFDFARALGMKMIERGDGRCTMAIDINAKQHFSPQRAAHGGVAYSLADSAMGGALTSLLPDDYWCATLEIKFNYHVRVGEGRLTCEAAVLHRGKRIANIEARLYQDERLVSSANGSFAIFPAPGARS